MFNAATGVTTNKLYSSVFGPVGSKKVVNLRTSFRSEPLRVGIGEVEAMLYKKGPTVMVMGTKSLPRPVGATFFAVDAFRKSSNSIWQLPEKSKIGNGLVALNVEPDYWIFAPQEDMELNFYKKLLEDSPWTKVSPDQRPKELGYGEGNTPRAKRDGLELIDQLIMEALEQFIQQSFRRLGFIKYDEDLLHADSDLCRVRLYLKHYVDREKDGRYDSYIKGGTLVKAKSHEQTVLRPNSELFRVALELEIQRLERLAKKSILEKQEGKEKQYLSYASHLKNFLNEAFPDVYK